MTNIFLIFAPICRDFYIDICKEIISKKKNILINGIFFEDRKNINNLIKIFPKENIGKFYFFKEDEIEIISSTKKLFLSNDDNIINRMISADRIAGSGYMQNVNYRRKLKYGDVFLKNTELPRKYCLELYFYIEEILNSINPKFIFSHAVSSALTLGIYHIATKKNIKFLSPKHTRLKNYFVIDEYEIGSIKKISETFNDLENNKINNNVKVESSNIFSELVNNNILPEYYHRTKNEKNQYSLFFLFMKGIKRILIALVSFKIDKLIIRNSFFDFLISINKYSYKWQKQIPDKYIYYPLHVDPEASTMVEAYLYTDQAYIIELISKSIPNDYKLVIKEHIPMLGLRNKTFYKKIQKLPNVMIIDSYIHPYEVIKNAKLTISITGTVSWESLCLGIPSIILEKVPHLIINDGIFYLDNIKNMNKLIHKSLIYKFTDKNKSKIINYISSIILTGFKLDSGFMWGNYSNYSITKKAAGVSLFYEQLKKYF